MSIELIKKTAIFLMLGLLAASAFFVRLENFKNSHKRSVDEFVYYSMAEQVLEEGLSGYHVMPYGKRLAATGRPLPEYFFRPLFKHPPLFTFFLVSSMRIFGATPLSAEYVSLLFGALMIPLTFLMGKELFDSKIGALAAMFIWLDPVNIMTAQKIWMDTTMNFFMLLAVYFFIRGMKSQRDNYFVFSGLACGLAMLTKYTGVLALVTVIFVAWFHRRDLFANKTFLFSLMLPCFMLLPWFYWNYRVYGHDFFIMQISLHRNNQVVKFLPLALMFGVLFWAVGRIIRRLRERFFKDTATNGSGSGWLSKRKLKIALGFFLLGTVFESILHSLQWGYLPRTSWAHTAFRQEPPVFYIGQLIEYSFIYVFAFAALLIERQETLKARAVLRYGSVITLLFFTVWRAFQCRYILFALPFLAILSASLILAIYQKIEKIDKIVPRLVFRNVFVFIVLYAFARTIYIDVFLSFTNDMCYY